MTGQQPDDLALCVLEPAEASPTQAVDGLLCRPHSYRLRVSLNSVRDNWREPAGGGGGFEPRVGGSVMVFGRRPTRVYPAAPIDLGRVDRGAVRDVVAELVNYWARAVASARTIQPANFPTGTVGQIDLLRLHLPWIIAQAAVVKFAADVQEMQSRLARKGASAPVGLCRQRTTHGRCDGELVKDRRDGVVRCHRDPSHIDHVRARRSSDGS